MQSLGELRRLAGLFVTLFFFAVLLSGCGGGGGGAPASSSFGNSLPPSTGPGDVEGFFPDAIGTSWNYFATATDSTPSYYFDSVTVTGTKSIMGQTASVFLESNPSGSGIPAEGYYFKNDGGVAFLGTNDATDAINAGIIPYIVGLFPVVPGVVAHFDKNGLDFGLDLDGDGINETMNLTLTSTINGFEALNIGIGSYAQTVKNTEAVTGSVLLSQLKTSVPFSSTTTRWSAPGIGVLKTSQSMAVQSVTFNEMMEARGYTGNGVAHGFGLPFTVAGNLAPGDSNYYNPGPPALATNGQNYLAVSANAAGMKGVLFDSQGTPLNIALASGVSPVAGFGGLNYWVIYDDASACLAQRVTTAGTVIDTIPINLVTLGLGYSSISSKGFGFGNTNGLLAYSTYNLSTSQHELHGVLVKPDGTVSPSFLIAPDISTHLHPSVAFDGTNFFVVWEQLPTSGATVGSIYGVLVSDSGSLVDAPFAISTAPNGQSSPSVAFDGTNYLVVWLDMRNQTVPTGVPYPDIYGARVSTAGALLDGTAASGGFPINNGGTLQRYSPSVGVSGAEYLVSWTVLGYANTGSPGIQAARVSTSGTLPSGPNKTIMVSGPPNGATSSQLVFPIIAAGPQHAAVVWLDNTELSGSQKAFVGASISPF
jgi:hypothetical protein